MDGDDAFGQVCTCERLSLPSWDVQQLSVDIFLFYWNIFEHKNILLLTVDINAEHFRSSIIW